MNELIFLVEEAPEGGFTARALGHSIFTEAESLEELRGNVRNAVHPSSTRIRPQESSGSILCATACSPVDPSNDFAPLMGNEDTARDLSGTDLAKALRRVGYEAIRQTGSHIRLATTDHGHHY